MEELIDTQGLLERAIERLVSRGGPFPEGWIMAQADSMLESGKEYLLEQAEFGSAYDFAIQAELVHEYCRRLDEDRFMPEMHRLLSDLAIEFQLDGGCLDELL